MIGNNLMDIFFVIRTEDKISHETDPPTSGDKRGLTDYG
jgi:hypothetical protein